MSARVLLVLAAVLAAAPALADPCGLVPPLYTGPGEPIIRVGPQRTYVFFKDGVETYVIRPGFKGKVEEFGMLIPFPSVPALRKVPEEVFAHIAAAVDPPEVTVDLCPRPRYEEYEDRMAMAPSSAPAEEAGLRYDEVKVLKQEAVGMYEIAVLAAGSAKALNRWMDEHGFKYPDGMDDVCNEYIAQGWVFVAEKTKVGSKPNADPRPGMKAVNPSLPSGANFNGYVQAMGFRFRVDKPVVPMRLSPFNPGEKRQIVYYLTEKGVKLDGMSSDLVRRQVSGYRLSRNVLQPLPLRIMCGKPAQVTKQMLEGLKGQRNPKPHNGHARALFASDLLALKTKDLSLDHEEKEKELLAVGEALNLRGPQIDVLHEAHLEVERDKGAARALSRMEGMVMTVVDGDFPGDYMKEHDLTVSRFLMPKKNNHRLAYDCRTDGPGSQTPGVRWEAP